MAEATEADYGPLEFPSNVEVNDNVPSEEKIAKVAGFSVFDVNGKKVPFRSLYEGANGGKKNHKVLVVSPTFLLWKLPGFFGVPQQRPSITRGVGGSSGPSVNRGCGLWLEQPHSILR